MLDKTMFMVVVVFYDLRAVMQYNIIYAKRVSEDTLHTNLILKIIIPRNRLGVHFSLDEIFIRPAGIDHEVNQIQYQVSSPNNQHLHFNAGDPDLCSQVIYELFLFGFGVVGGLCPELGQVRYFPDHFDSNRLNSVEHFDQLDVSVLVGVDVDYAADGSAQNGQYGPAFFNADPVHNLILHKLCSLDEN